MEIVSGRFDFPVGKDSRSTRFTILFLSLFMILCPAAVIQSRAQGQPGSTNASTRTHDEVIDLSEWVKEDSKLGITSFRRDEFFMRSKQRGSSYYYVLVAPAEYSSEGVTTVVTLRNVVGAASKLGYGLIFHSDPTPLKQGYGFLIDTIKKRYRVVHHVPDEEKLIISWTRSPYINGGKQANTLKVVDRGKTTDLYINGHLVDYVENTFAFMRGQPGLYTDSANIAFKNLTILH